MTTEDAVPYINVEEFRQDGYLQEINRLFLHPLGLALSITVDDDGVATGFAGIIDGRDDPEGWSYGPGMIDSVKAHQIENQRELFASVRQEKLGYVIQPLEDD